MSRAPRAACAADEAAIAKLEEEVRVLRQVSSEVNTTLDLDAICSIVLRTMDDLFGFRHALVLLLDEEAGALTIVASRGYPASALGARVPVGVGIVGTVARRKKMMRIGNLRERRAYMDAVRREVARSDKADRLRDVPDLPGLADAESQIAIPLLIKDRLVGVFSVETAEPRVFSERDETLVSIVANLAASAIHNAQQFRGLEGTVEERTRALERTSEELAIVREVGEKTSPRQTLEDVVGDSKAMRRSKELLRKVARSPASTVLLLGENGTGKDLAARAVHDGSARAAAPFMNITCSALAESLLESELFGHEKGAFTDARKEKRGLLELAHGGSVFLDEIGEMRLGLQAKLLRFLEAKTFKRVGGTRDITVDVRVIAATNRDLERMVGEGTFREDLYYRLKVLPVELPPLRERPGDVPALARHFLRHFAREFGKDVSTLAPEAMARLEAYAWPGNVRELKNAIERAVLLAEGKVLRAEDLALGSGASRERGEPAGGAGRGARGGAPFHLPEGGLDFEQMERALVVEALERASWNKARAARLLGMPRDWLRYRMEKFGLEEGQEPSPRSSSRDRDYPRASRE